LRILLSNMDILTETQNLWQRFQRGGAFRTYLAPRLRLVIPALVVFVAYSVATTAATVITLGGTRSILVLVGLLGAPVILLGSLYVLVFVFMLWLENRAIAHATHRIPKSTKKDVIGAFSSLRAVAKAFHPAVQAAGVVFLLVPLGFLAALSTGIAILMLALVLATPAAYAALDR
jgi:hypothetical protein